MRRLPNKPRLDANCVRADQGGQGHQVRGRLLMLLAAALVAACQASPPVNAPSSEAAADAGTASTSGLPVRPAGLLTPSQLAEILPQKDFFFANTHVPYEGEIEPTDAFIPYDQIEENLAQLPADRTAMIVVYCRSGRMSAIAAETLARLGYSNVWDLGGGMVAWEEAGLPLSRR